MCRAFCFEAVAAGDVPPSRWLDPSRMQIALIQYMEAG